MSERYPGGYITKNAPQPTGGESGTAPGVWTLEEAAEYQKAGTWPAPAKNYIENVFSTYIYTGNGSTQTITNNINLSTKGGLVWIKSRTAAINHCLFDTNRGVSQYLHSNATDAQQFASGFGVTNFGSTGFTVVDDSNGNYGVNGSGGTYGGNYVSWAFAKSEKFFDVVTYTGNGNATQTINHNLGSVPGCIIIKVTSQSDDWYVYHRSLSQSSGVPYWLNLNTTAVETFFGGGIMLNSTPTSTSFTVKGGVNGNGNTYIAYLFAHDAGGFGVNGTDNVISCSSFTTPSSGNASITLGWEPQWILVKCTTTLQNWWVVDTMRGLNTTETVNRLLASTTNIEATVSSAIKITATGFEVNSATFGANSFVYIAIRRGPMKTPTTGTSVFAPVVGSSLNSSFVTDFAFIDYKPGGSGTYPFSCARLTGNTYLKTSATSAELPMGSALYGAVQNGIGNAYFDSDFVGWLFQRAPSFMDVVCYTGDGTNNRPITHNLSVAPELAIVKQRNQSSSWLVWQKDLFISSGGLQKNLILNSTSEQDYYPFSTNSLGDTNYPSPTTTTINVGGVYTNASASVNYVMYLFASCPGVSKVGSYTGTGTTLQVNCGFTNGSRFVLIKRTDSTGDWYVWDSSRGIVSGNDPYLLLNSTAAEVTNTDYVDTYSAGFEISSTAPAAINANGGTFIYLAIA